MIDAWTLLAEKGVHPTLYLTLNEKVFPDLCLWIDSKKYLNKLNIINLGYIASREDILCYIKQSKCMIFPSLLESFGLPLVEAEFFNIPILAPELEYVRDIVNPVNTFNAKSPISICAAVLRFMNKEERSNILKPEEFINKIIL